MLNVTSLYTNIGSQFIPFVALPTKSKHTQLGSIPIFLPRKKKHLKNVYYLKAGKKWTKQLCQHCTYNSEQSQYQWLKENAREQQRD